MNMVPCSLPSRHPGCLSRVIAPRTVVRAACGRLLTVLGLVLGLATTSFAFDDDPSPDVIPVPEDEMAAPLPPFRISPAGYEADATYRLRPGDKLIFQVLAGQRDDPGILREDAEARAAFTVSDSGEIDVPYLGRLMAQDRTCRELVEEIKGALEQTFYYHATVIIALDTAATRHLGRVYVFGQVLRQGPITIPAGETLTAGKVILSAGGFGNFANKRAVRVVRRGPDGQEQSFQLNMQDILERGMLQDDIDLQANDFVFVPARAFNL